ncbi:c-type cytochrome [Thiothrix lacustris]|uniref:c-type cytochrome n=1 Tax=Thiothrix lacustris TaxID=525917 RepID=UPI00048E0861|nr:c-type cytochrome [Thiothrix lacustris]
MAHSTHKDPMAKPVLVGGLALIGTTIFVLVSNLFSTIDKNSTKGAEDTSMAAAAADINLAPIGSVVTVDKSIVKEARSGEAVYNAVCTSCHAAGVLGAPKLDDKGAWEPRVAQTLKVLLDHATNGIRSMPARGGDPTITDEELLNTIVYMTGKAGFDLSADAKGLVPGSADAAPAVAAAPAAEQAAEQAAAAPAEAPAAEQAAAAPAAEQAAAAPAEAPAAEQAAAAPAEAPAAEQAAAAPAEAPAAEQAAAPVAAAAIDGEKIYKGICFSCHDVGIAGSPKLGDKAAWAPRIATGNDAMYHNAINGKNVMPAKGGNPALSDDEVKAAVDFMVGKSQ